MFVPTQDPDQLYEYIPVPPETKPLNTTACPVTADDGVAADETFNVLIQLPDDDSHVCPAKQVVFNVATTAFVQAEISVPGLLHVYVV